MDRAAFFSLFLLVSSTGAFLTQPPQAARLARLAQLEETGTKLFTTRNVVVPRATSEEVLKLFNSQVTRELEASNLYLAASIWCDGQDFGGMAKYMRSESDEERNHALTMIDFASKRSIDLKLENMEAPAADWTTPEELWQDILYAEMENTQYLLELADAAAKCNDHAVTTFLMPYHMEQVNAEDSLRSILAKVREENKTPGLLRQLDTELGAQAGAHN